MLILYTQKTKAQTYYCLLHAQNKTAQDTVHLHKHTLTGWIQQSGDVKFSFSNVEGFLEVLSVRSCSGSGQVHYIRPQSMKYRQKHYATPPAHLKILHIQSTTSPEKTEKDEWFYSIESHCFQESLLAGCSSPLALLSDPQKQGFLGRYTETCVQG